MCYGKEVEGIENMQIIVIIGGPFNKRKKKTIETLVCHSTMEWRGKKNFEERSAVTDMTLCFQF